MRIKLSDSVYKKYFELLDSTWDIFGVDCELVFLEKREVVSLSDNAPVNNSINAHRRSSGNWSRGSATFKEVEVPVDVRMKIYWNPRDWARLTNNIVMPDNGIGTLFFEKDLAKVIEAKKLTVHKDINSKISIAFMRVSECYPVGLQQDRYFACTWERV